MVFCRSVSLPLTPLFKLIPCLLWITCNNFLSFVLFKLYNNDFNSVEFTILNFNQVHFKTKKATN